MHKLFYHIGFWNHKLKPFITEENRPVNRIKFKSDIAKIGYLHRNVVFICILVLVNHIKKGKMHCTDRSCGAINSIIKKFLW